jgi:hypothetical protein
MPCSKFVLPFCPAEAKCPFTAILSGAVIALPMEPGRDCVGDNGDKRVEDDMIVYYPKRHKTCRLVMRKNGQIHVPLL